MKEPNSDKLKKLINYIKVYNAVVVWGAGASYDAGMPLAGQLPPLVWSTLDRCKSVRRKVAENLSVKDTYANELIGEDWDKMEIAFKFISDDKGAVKTFKKVFTKLNNLKSNDYSKAHSSLVNLVHEGFVEYIVSLNWDTFIEDAWEAKYGTSINSDKLILSKPHGDVYNKNSEWIFPHEDGYVSQEVKKISEQLSNEYPRILVVIGYSESDDVIVNDFIKPLQNKWKIFRIGPGVKLKNGINTTAIEALSKMEDKLCKMKDSKMWENITFKNQMGIESAIRGMKLGPQNVKACTKFSLVDKATQQLKRIHYVIFEGESGSGKSISAYQAAHQFFANGWEVKRPKKRTIDNTTKLMKELHSFKTKSLVIIDDAQLYDEHFLVSLKEHANDRLKVIICTTTQDSYSADSIRISKTNSVEELSKDYMKRKSELVPIVREYDSHVGEGYTDIPLERRIKEASEANNPWLFNFIIRGGWKVAKSELNILKDYKDADTLLFIVAIWQVVHMDYPIKKNELENLCFNLEYGSKWLEKTLEILINRKAIIYENGYQCPHMEYASLVIKYFLDDLKENDCNKIMSIIHDLIMSKATPMLGISWLLNKIRFTDKFYWWKSAELFDEELIKVLQKRWDNSYSSLEKRDSIFVINRIYTWGTLERNELENNFDLILKWLTEADSTTAYALSRLINSSINQKDGNTKKLINKLDPVKLAHRFNNSDIGDGYTWGNLLNRLCYISDEQWRYKFIREINIETIRDKIIEYKHDYLNGLDQLISAIYLYNKENAFYLLDECMDIIENRMRINQLAAFEEIQDIRWTMLNEQPNLFRNKKPNRKQKKYSRKLVKLISFDNLARNLEKSNRRDWERYGRMIGEWMQAIDKRYHKKLIRKLNLELINNNTQGYWKCPCRELRILLMTLTCETFNRLAKELIDMNKEKIEVIDPITAYISPEAMEYVVSNGGTIDFDGHNGSEWDVFSLIIKQLDKFNEDVLKMTYDSFEEKLIKDISNLQRINCVPEFINFIQTLKDYLPNRLENIFVNLSIDRVKKSWEARVEGNSKEKETVCELLKLFREYRNEEIEELSDVENKLNKK